MAEVTKDPEIVELLRCFNYTHLPEHLQRVSADFHGLAWKLVERVPDHLQTKWALHWLLLAKDAAVRAALDLPRSTG